MIQPNSRLPWKEKLSKSGKKYQILDFNNNIIIDDVKHLGDSMYIEEACNNYPKSLELLKEALDQLESMIEEETFTKRRIKEFLNQIENG